MAGWGTGVQWVSVSDDCQTCGVVYKLTVDSMNKKLAYVGLTERTFKQRYANH